MELFPKVFGSGPSKWMRGMAVLAMAFHVASMSAGTVVQFRTELGDVEVELFDTDKPLTTSNFLRNVTEGWYQGSYFHEMREGSALTGGEYQVAGAGATNLPSGRSAIANEFNVGPKLSNVAGTLAMAPGTGSSNTPSLRFFFNLKDNPQLDSPTNSGGATVFGRVITGAPVLEKLKAFKPAQSLSVLAEKYFDQTNCILTIPSVVTNLPIYGFRKKAEASYEARVLMVDVSLLRVQVSKGNDGLTRIAWNPVYGRTNTVEYTDVFPPDWQKLADVAPASIPAPVYSGSGIPSPGTVLNLPVVVVDDNAAPNRFYRVRATY